MGSQTPLPTALPDDARNTLLEFSREARNLYGSRLTALYLFGSYARGEQHPGSDLDVLVVRRGKVNAGREIHAMSGIASRACLKFGQLLSTVPVSSETFRAAATPFLRNITRDRIPL